MNAPDASQIAVVDRAKETVSATWPLKKAAANFSLSLDEANHRMFVGCRYPATVLVYDWANGSQVASVPISRDTDDLFYDAEKKRLYVSCGAGGIEVIAQIDPDHYEKVETIPTASGARTSLFIVWLSRTEENSKPKFAFSRHAKAIISLE